MRTVSLTVMQSVTLAQLLRDPVLLRAALPEDVCLVRLDKGLQRRFFEDCNCVVPRLVRVENVDHGGPDFRCTHCHTLRCQMCHARIVSQPPGGDARTCHDCRYNYRHNHCHGFCDWDRCPAKTAESSNT